MLTAKTLRRAFSVVVVANCDDERPHLRKLLSLYGEVASRAEFVGWDRLKAFRRVSRKGDVDYVYIQRGWGYSNARLALGIPLWVFRATVACLRRRPDLIHAIDLDSALPAAIASLFSGVPFIYDIRDNYDLRYRYPPACKWLVRKVDGWVRGRSAGIIVVDEGRLDEGLRSLRDKVQILYNCPPDVPILRSAEARPFTVYASGYLSSERGIGLLLDAADALPHIRVLLAGRFHDPSLERRALGHPRVDCRGWLPQRHALELCSEADAVFSFYDPSLEINRSAASNKWFDAMMAALPVITNSEVRRAAWVIQEDIGYVCPYDKDSLVCLLRRVVDDPCASVKGTNGRHLYETSYNWSAMEARLLTLIAKTLSNLKAGLPR